MKRDVEGQAVQIYPYINQKDDSHPKLKHTDCKLAGSVLQVADFVDVDPILKEHSL